MNKKLLTILSLLIAFAAYSQVPRGFSVALGVNQAILNSDQITADGVLGFQGGFGFNMGYHETHNYQIDVLFSKNSLELPYVSDSSSPEVNAGTQKYNIVNIDVMFNFNYYVIKPDEDKFYIGPQAGVYFSVSHGQWLPTNEEDVYGHQYENGLDENSFTMMSQFNYGASLGIVGGYNKFRASLNIILV